MITGKDISARRKSLGWSQEALAHTAGVGQSVVSLVERDITQGVSVHLQNCVRQALSLELIHESPEPEPTPRPSTKHKRGFASLSPERQREIASLGGKAAHAKGVAHHFTPENAKVEGAKGACRDPDRMRELARLGANAMKDAAANRKPKTTGVP